MKPIFDSLRGRGYVGIFLGELLSKLSRDKGSKWVADKWDQSGLQLNNIIDTELEKVDKIIKDYVSYYWKHQWIFLNNNDNINDN